MDEHEAATPDVAGSRHRDGQRKPDGNGRIDGVAAIRQHLGADTRGDGVLRGHHPGCAIHGMMHRLVRGDRRTGLGRGR